MQVSPQLMPVARDQFLPLSADQYRVWFLHQLTPDLVHFNINFAFRVKGEFDPAVFKRSLNAVVGRHEALRTTFVCHGDMPQLAIRDTLALEVPVHDLRDMPAAEREEQARRAMQVLSLQPFSLSQGPLLRATIYRVEDAQWLVLFTIHHIVADYDSLKIITRDVFHFYNRERGTVQAGALEPLPVQYADYAWWQNERMKAGEYLKQLAYWKEQLGGEIPVLRMPMDRPRQAVVANRGAIVRHDFGRELTARLQQLSKDNGVTLFITLYSAYQVLLQRYTGQDDIHIGTPITTRSRPDLRQVVGLFINTLVLKSDLQGNPDFLELLKRNRKIAFAAFARQEIPYEKLVQELNPQRNLGHNLFFQTMVMLLEPESLGTAIAPGLDIQPFPLQKKTTTFELTLTFSVVDESLTLALDYNTDLYDESTVSNLLRHFDVLLNDIVKRPASKILDLNIVPAVQRNEIFDKYCGEPPSPIAPRRVHELFCEQARRTPDAVALRHLSAECSYAELDRRSGQLAQWLVRQGVQRGAIVGIMAHRSIEQIVALLGILKAGAAYLPIDPEHPADRIAYMLQNAGAAMVLASGSTACEGAGIAVHELEALLRALVDEPVDAGHEVKGAPDDLMYVIYTSGSTGKPKGVMVTHRNVVNHCKGIVERFGLVPQDKVLQFTSVSFDVSVQEIFPTLLQGATLVLWKDRRLEGTEAFLSWTAEQGISILNLTTAHWNNIVADLRRHALPAPRHLRLVVVGGEKINPETWAAWDEIVGTGIGLVNDYGLTETTVTATMFRPAHGFRTQGAFPVGTPICNVEVYVLDAAMAPLPVGVFGELYVGGLGIAKGYINDPELTKQKFIANPFGPGLLFKTGDRARFRRDGNLEFEGRIDQQVKIRGHRIEPQEAESRIAAFDTPLKSVVVTHEASPGNASLVAYLVADEKTFDLDKLKAWLKAGLPDYMVPSAYVFIDEVPLTVNGKVDKGRLPQPSGVAPADLHQAPATEAERIVVECCEALLQRGAVGVQSSFFDIGGDSLLATQLVSRLKQRTGKTVPLRLLFEYPRLADFAAQLEAVMAGAQLRADQCLVKIRQTGSKTPLFYVHPVGGTVSCYFPLARALGEEQPFHALQSHAMVDRESPLETVEQMAAHYLAEVRAVQPHGPYRLGGWSMGGFIAYEMARLLADAGETVAELTLIDTYLTKSRVADDQTILFNFVLQLAAVPGAKVSEADIRAWGDKTLAHADVCQALRTAGLVPAGFSDDEIRHLIKVYTRTVHAFKLYDPQPRQRLALDKVVLFRARDSHEEKGIWPELVQDLELVQVDADHFGIVRHEEVAQVLRSL